MRTFQFSDAKSHKFWSIDVSGASYTVTYGKVGSAGQTQTKSFDTAERAEREAAKLIAEKTKKGYAETTPLESISDAEAFERTLMANPHDTVAWGAYADYLSERDDPRGEFMQVQLALEDESLSAATRKAMTKREAKLLDEHRVEWLGPLAEFASEKPKASASDRPGVNVTFSRGWINRVEFPSLTVAQARALAKTDAARLMRELVVDEIDYEGGVFETGPDIPEDADEEFGYGLYALVRCPHLANVRHFRQQHPPLTSGHTDRTRVPPQLFTPRKRDGAARHSAVASSRR